MTTDALIKSVSIEAMLQAREAIEERLASIHALVKEIDGIDQYASGKRIQDDRRKARWPLARGTGLAEGQGPGAIHVA